VLEPSPPKFAPAAGASSSETDQETDVKYNCTSQILADGKSQHLPYPAKVRALASQPLANLKSPCPAIFGLTSHVWQPPTLQRLLYLLCRMQACLQAQQGVWGLQSACQRLYLGLSLGAYLEGCGVGRCS